MTEPAPGSRFTVGIEEELLLVDRASLDLDPMAGDVLTKLSVPVSSADHEAYAAQIELRSDPAATALEAARTLSGLRTAAIAAGGTLMGTGLHPTAPYGTAQLVETERYRDVEHTLRGLIRRTPESALHVHIGMPSQEAAVAAHNALRAELPLLLALSANSPWWFGVDSGLASARYAVVRAYPGRGVPRALVDHEDWSRLVEAVVRAGSLPDATFYWPDVRIHPTLGTVEVREMDAQSSLRHVAAIVALVRALAREAVETPRPDHEPSEALTWSMFRAARDGLGATILRGAAHRDVADVVRTTVERVRPLAADNGDEKELQLLEEILLAGGGAARRRRAFDAAGLRGMLRDLVDETHEPLSSGTHPVGSEASDPSTEHTVRDWLAARAGRDLERLAALTSERASWASPVDGVHHGRAAVLDHVAAAYRDTEWFETETLSVEVRAAKAVAMVRNTGRRGADALDSVQMLFLTVANGKVTSVGIAVDDPHAVEEFWAGATSEPR
jgi:glutamate---cysteine ligase / carboxylate-amine ligase